MTDKRCLTNGDPVNEDHLKIKENGQQEDYVVICPEDRAKGFVRPLRYSYVHNECKSVTNISMSIAQTYARDPKFYNGTFCAGCGSHFPLDQFVWQDTNIQVGT